ncbi:hypothetical protein SERLA73DRAFT_80309 [Serpula lacrymans var. lacrymans S7.3]|uniref:Uncharacterized protein n=1 Tax=Serpula lacrymans var. lacrymans (strain S7.3) TaxID=936435 RepID=F8QJD0_SERL3|nr:hypothetical protein SERLA73DRAFT_80309 [Serpula lacrymans var. lacrymans S7.3]
MPGVKDFALQANNYLLIAHDAIIASRVNQTHQANTLRREENTYKGMEATAQIYWAVQYCPHKCGEVYNILKLPEELKDEWIHPIFYAGLLRKHEPNDNSLFPERGTKAFYDFGEPDKTEWLVDEIIAHPFECKQDMIPHEVELGRHYLGTLELLQGARSSR